MTAVLQPDRVDVAPPWRRRRWWVIGIPLVLVLALIGTGIWWLVYINTYQPLGPGGIETDASYPHGAAVTLTDGVRDTDIMLRGPVGRKATFVITIQNTGRFAATITGLADSDVPPGTSLSWSSLLDFTSLPDLQHHERSFPLTLRPHEGAVIDVTLAAQRCESGDFMSLDELPLGWRALGVHHIYPLDLAFLGERVDLCPSTAALRHVDRS